MLEVGSVFEVGSAFAVGPVFEVGSAFEVGFKGISALGAVVGSVVGSGTSAALRTQRRRRVYFEKPS